MSEAYISVLFLASLSIKTTIIGVGLAFCFKKSTRAIIIGIGFSTGIMLLISLFELIPESIYVIGTSKALLAVLLGGFFVGILNFVIPHIHFFNEGNQSSLRMIKTAYLIAFGLILHDFPEGFAMANSYIHSPSLGVLIALAIAVHNIPEEFAMAVPLLLVGKKKILFKTALLSGLAEPVGAMVGLAVVGLYPTLNPILMTFAAGAMIFVSLHELLPMAQRYKRKGLFVVGIIISLLVYLGLTFIIPE